jgi:hypothetical protein
MTDLKKMIEEQNMKENLGEYRLNPWGTISFYPNKVWARIRGYSQMEKEMNKPVISTQKPRKSKASEQAKIHFQKVE